MIAALDMTHQHDHLALGPAIGQGPGAGDVGVSQVRYRRRAEQPKGQRDDQQRRSQHDHSVSVTGKAARIDRAPQAKKAQSQFHIKPPRRHPPSHSMARQ
ncbi:hypothetical protein D3C76_1640550 [compost metagenome]